MLGLPATAVDAFPALIAQKASGREEVFAFLASLGFAAIEVHASDGVITGASHEASVLFGRQDLEGVPVQSLICLHGDDDFQTAFSKVLSGGVDRLLVEASFFRSQFPFEAQLLIFAKTDRNTVGNIYFAVERESMRPITTPLTQANEDEATESLPPRVLVVEDGSYFRRSLIAAMTAARFQVVVTESGYEALGILRRNVFDVILLGVFLPEMDRNLVLQTLQMESVNPNARVVLLSSRSLRVDIDRTNQLGVKRHFMKPDTSISTIVAEVSRLAASAAQYRI